MLEVEYHCYAVGMKQEWNFALSLLQIVFAMHKRKLMYRVEVG